MEAVVAIGSRSVLGLVLGLFMAVVGFFIGWLATPPGPELPMPLLTSTSGVGASIGGFFGWFKPEAPRRVNALHMGLAVLGGLAGAWVGLVCGQLIYPEGVYNPGLSFKTPPLIAAMIGASVGANVLVSGLYIFRLWRHKEV